MEPVSKETRTRSSPQIQQASENQKANFAKNGDDGWRRDPRRNDVMASIKHQPIVGRRSVGPRT
jgi:hypothetical protein